jgi:hypothetical protein
MGIKDKAKEKLEEEEHRGEQEPSGGKDKTTTANEPDPSQGVRGGDEAPNPTKAAEDVD